VAGAGLVASGGAANHHRHEKAPGWVPTARSAKLGSR